MLAWLASIWTTDDYLPHGLCLAWEPGLIWLQVISDGLIAFSYYSIPAALAYFAIKRKDLPFQGVFILFMLFILACGTTHLLGAVTLWDPVYRLTTVVEVVTAVTSVPTAFVLWALLPAALALPSHQQLEAANQNLFREIEERRRAEQEVRRINAELDERIRSRTAQLQSILDTVPDAMIVISADGIIDSFSVAAERMFGYAAHDVRGRNVSLLIPSLLPGGNGSYRGQFISSPERRSISAPSSSGKRRDGSDFAMELSVGEVTHSGQPLFTCFVHDLTERQESEHRVQELRGELAHVSRVTEMGQMASGLAHELNQPLSATGNYLAALRRLLQRGDAAALANARLATDRAIEQVQRTGQIIQRLREFVKKSTPERRPENVVTLLQEASTLALMATNRHDVALHYSGSVDPPAVLVDKVQIQQVMVNILRNAVEAMEASPRREINIDVAPVGGGLVSIAVADTGHGIADHIVQRLFQPFVTTKQQGMGVGLSLCRSIVEAHGGRLWAEPNPRGGAIFRFTVPVAG